VRGYGGQLGGGRVARHTAHLAPTVRTCLGRVIKPHILDAVREAVSDEALTGWQYSIAVLDRRRRITRELPELFQPVEKKGKCDSSIARIICRPKNRLDRLNYEIQ
jgi:hypothetical protein